MNDPVDPALIDDAIRDAFRPRELGEVRVDLGARRAWALAHHRVEVVEPDS